MLRFVDPRRHPPAARGPEVGSGPLRRSRRWGMTLRRPWSYPRAAAAAALAAMLALAAAQPFGGAAAPRATSTSTSTATVSRAAATGRLLVRVIVQGSTPGSR